MMFLISKRAALIFPPPCHSSACSTGAEHERARACMCVCTRVNHCLYIIVQELLHG